MDLALMALNGMRSQWEFVIILAAGMLLLPVILTLTRWGRLDAAGHLILAAIWGMVSLSMIIGAGLWSLSVIHLMLLVVVGGLLLGSRGLVVWTGMSLLTIGALFIRHQQGLIEISPYSLAAVQHRGIELALAISIACVALVAVQRLQNQIISRLHAEVEERHRAEQIAIEAAHAKERFLATMSHELRTPLNGILGAAGLLHTAERREDAAALSGMIASSAELLLALVNDILDYSRVGAEALQLESVPLHLEVLLSEVTAPLLLLAQQKGVALSTHTDPHLPLWILSDPVRLRQILLNLTSNAVKFTERGQVTVRIARSPGGSHWTLAVSDTGIGISPAAQATLFRPFAQADASTTRRYGGTGLGLAIVHRIVDRMEGTITVDSTLGEGSTFTVTLPLQSAAPPALPPAVQVEPLPSLRILVVDDHPVNRTVISRTLALAGHQIQEATDGAEASSLASRADWDVILMDCQMPVCDGYDATQHIRQLPAPRGQVVIIGLSANALAGDRERALAAGMDDYLTKPVRPDLLHQTLRRWSAPPTPVAHAPSG